MNRERWIHDGRGYRLVFGHGGQSQARPAQRFDLVIPLIDAVQSQDFIKLKRVCRINRIHPDRLSSDVGQRIDLRLQDEVVEAVVAAADHRDIDAGLVLERECVVDGGVRNLVATFGKSLA